MQNNEKKRAASGAEAIEIQSCTDIWEAQSLGAFTETLASSAPTPGGGGAAGVCGALGAALGNMVVQLTLGKKKYAVYEAELEELDCFFAKARTRFLSLAAEDEAVFQPLAAAYRLPSSTESERTAKQAALEPLLEAAARTPLRLMELAADTAQRIERLSAIGSRLAISDAAAGIRMIEAASEAALMNVLINAKSMTNRTNAEALCRQAEALLLDTKACSDRTFQAIKMSLQ